MANRVKFRSDCTDGKEDTTSCRIGKEPAMTPWKHWGLLASPFRGPAAYFFRGEPQDEALARLQFLADERRPLALVTGVAGSGKTQLLVHFARLMRLTGRRVVELSLLGLTAPEWLQGLAEQLGTPGPAAEMSELWRCVTDRLAEHRYQGTGVILLADDAGALPGDLATALTRLALLAVGSGGALSLALAVERGELRSVAPRLRDLAELHVELTPWQEDETAEFLRATLDHAGAIPEAFHPDALLRIHELSGGLPRRATHLAEVALLAGAASEARQIDEYTVDAVFQEFAGPLVADFAT